jgi:hypothetical protein
VFLGGARALRTSGCSLLGGMCRPLPGWMDEHGWVGVK